MSECVEYSPVPISVENFSPASLGARISPDALEGLMALRKALKNNSHHPTLEKNIQTPDTTFADLIQTGQYDATPEDVRTKCDDQSDRQHQTTELRSDETIFPSLYYKQLGSGDPRHALRRWQGQYEVQYKNGKRVIKKRPDKQPGVGEAKVKRGDDEGFFAKRKHHQMRQEGKRVPVEWHEDDIDQSSQNNPISYPVRYVSQSEGYKDRNHYLNLPEINRYRDVSRGIPRRVKKEKYFGRGR